jgi:hypothetical protein
MKKNKKLLVAAVAGALTAAAAVPAFALENEFHGAFTSYYDVSNFSGVGNDGGEAGTTGNATGLHHDAKTENYFVQRVRLGYIAKVSDQVKLNTKFELDYKYLGNSSYVVGRNTGGALGADSVNLETKNLYLELNYPAVNAKLGMMPYNDSFKGILFDADMAGVLLSHDYSNASVAAGFFRFSDESLANAGDSDRTLGKKTNDMISLDAKYNLGKDVKVGAAYYYITDNRGTVNQDVHTFGLNAEALVGPMTLNGFIAKQAGDARGTAFNMGAKVPVFKGTVRSEFIYVSGAGTPGGGNRFFVPQSPVGSEGAALYDNEMIILHRDKNAKTIDTSIIYDVNNYDQGMIMGSIGYDCPCTDKITTSVNAGFAAVARDNGSATAPRHDSNYLGTELNLESNYKLNANTTIGIRGGYVFLGDYFRGLNADNPYDFKVIANLAF